MSFLVAMLSSIIVMSILHMLSCRVIFQSHDTDSTHELSRLQSRLRERESEMSHELETQKSLYDAIIEKLKQKIATMVNTELTSNHISISILPHHVNISHQIQF